MSQQEIRSNYTTTSSVTTDVLNFTTVSSVRTVDMDFLNILKTAEDNSEDIKIERYPIVQAFKDDKLEKDFLNFYFGKNMLFFRVSMLTASILYLIVFCYDFLTFSLDLTPVKNGSVLLRIIFQVSRFFEVCASVLLYVMSFFPFFYKNLRVVEVVVVVYLCFCMAISTFHAIVITDRSLVLTVGFCLFNLFRTRYYGILLASAISILVYLPIGAYMEDTFIYISTIVVLSVMYLLQLLIGYFYERVSRNLFESKCRVERKMYIITKERDRGHSLLRNILPSHLVVNVVTGDLVVEPHKNSVVSLLDICEFSTFCQRITAKDLIEFLNNVYYHFDIISEKYSLEKITTIGDRYLICTLFQTKEVAALNTLKGASRMIRIFKKICRKKKVNLGVQVGISMGDIHMTLMGKIKYSFHIFGMPVNEAFEMVRTGERNKIHIHESLYQFAKSEISKEIGFEKKQGGGYILEPKIDSVYSYSTTFREDIPIEISENRFTERDVEYMGRTLDPDEILDLSAQRNGTSVTVQSKFSRLLRGLFPIDFVFQDLILFFPSISEIMKYYISDYKMSRPFSRLCFVMFVFLISVGEINTRIFCDNNNYLIISTVILIISIICAISSVVLSFFEKKYSGKFLVSVMYCSTCFFAFVLSFGYIWSVIIITITTSALRENEFFVYDLLGQILPFMTLMWPSIPLFLKMVVIMIYNFPFALLVLFKFTLPSNLFNFFCNFVASLVGYYFFHLNSLLQYKKHKLLNEKNELLSKEVEKNQRILNSTLPKDVVAKLLESRSFYCETITRSAIGFIFVKHLGNIKEVLTKVNLLNDLFVTFDNIVLRDQGECGIKIKNVETKYLFVSSVKNVPHGQYFDEECKKRFLRLSVRLLRAGKDCVRMFECDDAKGVTLNFGLNFGSFSGGVVGKHKWLFDIFGNDINVCYRYAELSKENQIHLTPNFVKGLDDLVSSGNIKYDGKFSGKGKGGEKRKSYYYYPPNPAPVANANPNAPPNAPANQNPVIANPNQNQ